MLNTAKKHNIPTWVVFLRLHPFNFPLAWLISLFKPVAYWKVERIPLHYCQRFLRLKPQKLYMYGQAEWNSMTADAYHEFAAVLPMEWKELCITGRFDGLTVDFTSAALNEVSEEFEAHYQFYHLVCKWKNSLSDDVNVQLVDTSFRRDMKKLDMALPEPNAEIKFGISTWLDRCMSQAGKTGRIVRALHQTLRCNNDVEPSKIRFRVFWQGISLNELADGPKKYDFSFLVQRNLVKSEDILYLLPIRPKQSTCDWLKRKKVHWVVYEDYVNWVPRAERWNIIRDLLSNLFLPEWVQGPSILSHKVAGFIANGALMHHVIKASSADTFIASSSDHSTSGAINAMSRASGLRTIMWQYSQAGIMPFHHDEDINKNLSCKRLVQSIFVADEQWVWYKSDIDLLSERCLQPQNYTPKFRVTLPVMSGDFNWLLKTPKQARRNMGVLEADEKNLLWLGVFDIETKEEDVLIGHRVGTNRFPEEMQVNFFRDLCLALEHFPDLRILFKPKRRNATDKFIRSKEMQHLIDPDGPYVKEGRVLFLDHNIDPHIPIAMSDCCVGAPYTSGIFLANVVGRPSIYYDPIGMYSDCYPAEFNDFRINGQNVLFDRIESWIAGDRGINSSLVSKELIQRDPAEEFAFMLLE